MRHFQARELAANEHAAWQSFIKTSPDGSIYSDPDYLASLCEATGASFRIVGLFRGDNLEGGAALYECRSMAGFHAAPRLLLYYSGPVLARYQTKYPSEQAARHVDAQECLTRHLGSIGYDAIVMKGLPSVTDVRAFLAAGWQVSPGYSYVVPLADLARQWERVEQNLRRLIKRCTERDHLTCAADNDFDAFYRLHELTLTRKGAMLYLPREQFQRFFARLEKARLARIFTARLPDGQAAASQLVLLGAFEGSHTVCAGGDPQHARLGAHAFLRWRVFEQLAAEGYKWNDLTDAALNSVTHFKSQLGGDLVTSHVLSAPASTRYAAVTGARDLVHLGAGIARGVYRRLARGPRR